MWWTFLILTLVPVNCQYLNLTNVENLKSPCTDKNHLVLTPGVLTAGGTNRACVSRFHTDGVAHLLLSLLTEDRETVTASRELPPGDGGCLDINVPLLPNTKADFIVNIRYPESQCAWERRTSVRISSGRIVTLTTERVRYKRGELVRARIFVLKPDLTPAHNIIDEVWLEGPEGAWEGTRVTQWQKVRTRIGIAQVQYQLDPLAPPGQWTLRAKLADGSQGSSVFTVGDYTLPPFQLSVRHSPKVLRTSERLSWTVCVRYPWSEAVEGMLVIRLRGAGSSLGVRTAVQLLAPKPCHRHSVAARRLGLDGSNPPDVLVADFAFQEKGTRIWQNTTVVSQVVEKRVTLEFLTKHRAVISPGLPYKIKVKATRFDDKPAPKETIVVCRYSTLDKQTVDKQTDTCATAVSDANGVAAVMFLPGDDQATYYSFEASIPNTSSIASLVLSVWRGSSAALGPLRADSTARTLVPLYLNMKNVSTAITVHFVVITRGGIIYRWGATTQCPITNPTDQVRTAPKNSRCNNYYVTQNNIQQNNIPQKYRNLYDYNSLNMLTNTKKYHTSNAKYLNHDSNIPHSNRYNRNSDRYNPYSDTYNQNSGTYNPYSDRYNPNSRAYNPNSRYNPNSDAYNPNSARYNNYPTNLDINNLPNADRFNRMINNVPQVSSNNIGATNVSNATSDLLLDRQQLRVMLPIKVSHQMCPDSHLIAYFYHEGELVSASKHFEMDECFGIKAEATWSTRQAQPGSPVTLHINTPGPALCALSVLDTASKWVQPPPAPRDIIMSGLRKLVESHRNLTEYDVAGDCFLNSDTPPAPTTGIEMTSTWLSAAGVTMLGGDVQLQRHCELVPAELMTDHTIVARSDFSEAWLWRLLPVSSNGSASAVAHTPDSITRFEASAVCVSRNGVAIAQPAVLQVFREFFIHADSPKRLRRGDSTIIRYRIFNYLYEHLSVQIQVLPDASLEGISESTETVCISARSSLAKRVSIRARHSSSGAVRVRARSNGACGNHSSGGRGGGDEVVIRIEVDPEGVPVQEQKSILLCGNNGSSDTTSEVQWKWPQVDAVPGTETLTVWTVGDVTGPLLADAEGLVRLPRGCGEQNLAQLAASLLALTLLHHDHIAALTAKEYVARGFTRQLQYIHPSGGFSAFGASDTTSSTWLTAFAVRYMRRAHKVLWPNLQVPQAIIRAERWLLSQQMENGCFRNEGHVFHRELRGGLNEEGEIANVALTAYVITSLIESTSFLPHKVIRNSLSCLRALPPAKSKSPNKVYAQALVAFAFTKLEEYEKELWKTNEAGYLKMGLEEDEGRRHVMELVKVARKSGGLMWWEAYSLSTSIEATSYAMLALRVSNIPDWISLTTAAGRWLAKHRSASGGFVSTQDTLVALEALTSWREHSPRTMLNVTAFTSGPKYTVQLQPAVNVPDVINMELGEKLTVNVEGTGCALIQATRTYNTLAPVTSQDKVLSLQMSVQTDGPFDCYGNESCSCAAVIETCVVWATDFPEMALLEVTLPGGYGADAHLLYSQLDKQDSLLRRIELTPSNSRATLYLATRDGGAASPGGHQCYYIHAVGPKTSTKPAYARVQDYYKPSVNDTQIYTIPEECPPRISHDTNDYLPSDNLFAKARSLDNDEILITDEYSFDDVPDGIPLDDPLYENLAEEEKHDESVEKSNGNKEKSLDHISLSLKEAVGDLNYQVSNINTRNEQSKNAATSNKTTVESISTTTFKVNNNNTKEVNNKNLQAVNENVSTNKPFNTHLEPVEINENYKPVDEDRTKYSEKIKIISDTQKILQPNQEWYYNQVGSHSNYNTRINNPILSDFHIINTDKDLEVPSGIEGPVPTVVLPPPDFIPPGDIKLRRNFPPEELMLPRNIFSGDSMLPRYVPYGDPMVPRNNPPGDPMLPRNIPLGDLTFPNNIPPGDPRLPRNFPPRNLHQGNQGRGLKSVNTPYGQYYYLKPEDYFNDRRYFIPEQLEPRNARLNHRRVH